ncbi:MAG: diguanylate cyclase [Dictyoglomaceae bacterium]
MNFFQRFIRKDFTYFWAYEDTSSEIFFTDKKLNLIFCNKRFEQRFLEDTKMLNKRLFDVLPEFINKTSYYNRALRGEEFKIEEGLRQISISPLFIEDKIMGTVTIIEDIYEKKDYEILKELFKDFNSFDFEGVLKKVLKSLINLSGATFGGIFQVCDGDIDLKVFYPSLDMEFRGDDTSILPKILKGGKSLYILDIRKMQLLGIAPKTVSALGIPLKFKDRVLGALILEFNKKTNLENEMISFIENLGGYIGSILEYTNTLNNYEELEDRYKLLVEQSLIGIFILQDKKMVYTNTQLLEILGYPSKLEKIEDLLGLMVGEYKGKFQSRYDEAFKKRHYVIDEFKVMRGDGISVYLEITIVSTLYRGRPAIMGTVLDITYRKQLEEKLKLLSNTDPLTKLHNRRGFNTLADYTLKLAKRLDKKLVLIFTDVDNMKWINDTFGHKVGDMALKEVAEIFRKTFRENDLIVRIGGDEFVVLSVVDKEEDKEELLLRLNKNIEQYNNRENRLYKISLSIGAVFCNSTEVSSVEEILNKADKLMYEEKKLKKNTLKK